MTPSQQQRMTETRNKHVGYHRQQKTNLIIKDDPLTKVREKSFAMPRWCWGSQKRADIALHTTAIALRHIGTLCNCRDVVLFAHLMVEFVVLTTLTCEMRAER